MITETRLDRFLGRSVLIFRLSSKSCIYYLYVDVKEPALPGGTRSPGFRNLFLHTKLKTIVSASVLPSAICRSSRVGVTGFEPVTLRLSSACSNQLSYTPRRPRPDHLHPGHLLVEAWGFEPQTYSLQSYRSTN